MPIIPSSWTGQQQINAIASSGSGSGSPQWKYSTSIDSIITGDNPTPLIGYVDDLINREISLTVTDGLISLYWINIDGSFTLIDELAVGHQLKDNITNNLGMAFTGSGRVKLKIRWDNNIDFYIYGNENEVEIIPLITVQNNTFSINEIEAINYSDAIICTAYFPDGFIPSASWHSLYTVNCEGNWEIIRGEVGSPNYIYPSQNDPFTFSFFPQQTIQGHFEIYRTSGELEFTEILRIVSFDNLTNTFIIDFP